MTATPDPAGQRLTQAATSAGASPPPGTAGAPRWMKVLLALSLAFNLAVAGLVAGAMLRDGPPHRARLAQDLNFGPFTEALSKEDRAALRRDFLQAAPEFRDQRRQARADTSAILALLRKDPLDTAALAALLEAQNLRALQRFDTGRGLMVDRISAMTPAERSAFADRLEKGLRKGPRRKDAGTE